MKNQKERLYKENAIQEDLYHFEMGNELGAHIANQKQQHEKVYKESTLKDNMNQNPYNNNNQQK